jgi:hypothetical protein
LAENCNFPLIFSPNIWNCEFIKKKINKISLYGYRYIFWAAEFFRQRPKFIDLAETFFQELGTLGVEEERRLFMFLQLANAIPVLAIIKGGKFNYLRHWHPQCLPSSGSLGP